ncbi:MAG: FAD-dependent oxidoreductase [Anaerolineales bacterium]|nr:FAD-dependent oxidoreductase [Anaerolineales bacterium]
MGRHENIELLTLSEIEELSGYVGNFKATIRQKARYVQEDMCTGCEACTQVCPIEVLNPFELGLAMRHATYRNSAQSTPNAFAIQKTGIAPCRDACPADQRAMGYISLVKKHRFADAYWTIRRENPFPSVCGRVCNHVCEDACSRGEYDEPVNIVAIKRFVADWAYQHRDELDQMPDKSIPGTPFIHKHQPTGKKVAIIGSGPAGLTAALDLVRLGHKPVVYEQFSEPGGMMRVGIPPHRLPYDRLAWEIDLIRREGVEIHLNHRVSNAPGLLNKGFDAVLIAAGVHNAVKLPIDNSDHPGNWLSTEFLRKVLLGERIDLSGRHVIVLGAGDVALDVARTAIRLGQPKVQILCRGMRCSEHELKAAEEEGVRILSSRVFKKVVTADEKIIGIRCLDAEVGGIVDGRRIVREKPGTEHLVEGDLIIWALGQKGDYDFLPEETPIVSQNPTGIQTNNEMMTNIDGVFVAGDIRQGWTSFVVNAIDEGHHAARAIDRYLNAGAGIPEPSHGMPVAKLTREEIELKITAGRASNQPRIKISSIPPEERINNFKEVDLTLTEDQVVAEASRCLECGVCGECMECVAACEKGAIDHTMRDRIIDVNIGAVIVTTGFKDFDPRIAPEYGYQYPNVITALEFERMINPSGPTGGKVVMKNGRRPRKVAIIHCVGSRDDKYHQYCSRACCMYSLKTAQLVHEYVEAEVHEIYRDMRTFGKGYEEFFNRTKQEGVHFHHGRVKSITREEGYLHVSWDEAFFQQPDHVDVDMVILATGMEPQQDAARLAATLGISRSNDGFFLELHPKLGPVETRSEGIFLAGACQSPKDIPDTVAQAGGAAAAALSLIDQGTVKLDPAIAQVQEALCAGCGQCATVCPYGAIWIENGIAHIDEYNCKGCGTCAATCPNKAMTLIHFDDKQLISELVGALS